MGPIPEGSIEEANRLLQQLQALRAQQQHLDSFLQDQRAAPWTSSGRIPPNVSRSRAVATIPTSYDKWPPEMRSAPIADLVKQRQALTNEMEILRAAHSLNSPTWNLPNNLPQPPSRPYVPRTPVPSIIPHLINKLLGGGLTVLDLMQPGELNKGEDQELARRNPPPKPNLQQVAPTANVPWFQLF